MLSLKQGGIKYYFGGLLKIDVVSNPAYQSKNMDITRRANMTNMEAIIIKWQLMWLGHVIHMIRKTSFSPKKKKKKKRSVV